MANNKPASRSWTDIQMVLAAFSMALTLGLRSLGFFVSMYGSADLVLGLFAGLQAYLFQAWRDSAG